jgi:hypothetical protein
MRKKLKNSLRLPIKTLFQKNAKKHRISSPIKNAPSNLVSAFFMKNQASFVPQGYHSHVKSKLLSVRVPVKQIVKARIKK